MEQKTMRKIVFIPLLMAFCLTGCGKEKSHDNVNANQCKLTINPFGYGYIFSGTMYNDSKADASNILMEVYFKDVYRQEYQIPAVYTVDYLSKNSSYDFSFLFNDY